MPVLKATENTIPTISTELDGIIESIRVREYPLSGRLDRLCKVVPRSHGNNKVALASGLLGASSYFLASNRMDEGNAKIAGVSTAGVSFLANRLLVKHCTAEKINLRTKDLLLRTKEHALICLLKGACLDNKDTSWPLVYRRIVTLLHYPHGAEDAATLLVEMAHDRAKEEVQAYHPDAEVQAHHLDDPLLFQGAKTEYH